MCPQCLLLVSPPTPSHSPCPQDDPVAMTTHELPSSAVAFSVTGLSPGRPFELLVQARRGPHLGAPGVLRLRTGGNTGTPQGCLETPWEQGRGWGNRERGEDGEGLGSCTFAQVGTPGDKARGIEMELGTQLGQEWECGWKDSSGDSGWHGDRDRIVYKWEWGWHRDGDSDDMGSAWGQG